MTIKSENKNKQLKILLVAAENDALPGGKVGGIGDVVRDIPRALAVMGQLVDVVVPGYGVFSQLPGAEFVDKLEVMFYGKTETVEVYRLFTDNKQKNVSQWILEHPLFACGGIGKIYCNDPDNRPFASDATKFALFSAAVAKAITDYIFGHIDAIHLNDWHAAMVAVLRAYDPQYRQLQGIHTVYTIHNLALQGIRPFEFDESSFKAWFPDLKYDAQQIADPHFGHCFNPMRAGINLSDRVHAVSPSYAKEILKPSNHSHGYFGGEGLQGDLGRAAEEGRLYGILNGCEYPPQSRTGLDLKDLLSLFDSEILRWIGASPLVESCHLIAMTRIAQISSSQYSEPPILVTSVGRITEQKVRLFLHKMENGETALGELLNHLGDQGFFILVGSGDKKLEQSLTKIASIKSNFIFLKGYSDRLSNNLYDSGDLFLMPSSFEPCGISQMLAMRAGQVCLAHRVGGLRDTIEHEKNGLTFDGDTPAEQVSNMLRCFKEALALKRKNKKKWDRLAKNAAKSRFLWKDSAAKYIQDLYQKF